MAENSKVTPVDPRKAWTPPPRPEWLARLNEEGRCMNIRAIVPLEPQELIKTAISDTGLSDFRDHVCGEPFEMLCRSLKEDTDLTLWGRIRSRSEILLLLENRLLIEK